MVISYKNKCSIQDCKLQEGYITKIKLDGNVIVMSVLFFSFDFPLLVAQLKASSHDVPQEVLCADSLEAFRAFDGLSPVPEFVCKRSKNNNEYTTESTSSTSLKNGSLANSEEQLENRVEECAETQDPNGDVETTSFHGKRLHECGGKHTEYNGTTGSGSGATHWEASGESTPVKKMARLEPGPPTKQSVSPHGLEAGFRQREADVRQNLFGSSPYISGGEDSQQTVAYSQSGAAEGTDPSEPETNGQARQKGAGLKCHRELFPLEEPDAKSESSSQPNFSSNLSSLSEDSEKLLLEAVQQAEQAEAGMLNTGSVAGGDQAMLSSKETGQTLNKTPCPPKVKGSVNPKHSPGRADNSGGKPQKVSYSLPKIYMRLFGQEPPASHEAEDDCRTLLKVIQASSKNTFPHWCDQNAVSLSSIEPMY